MSAFLQTMARLGPVRLGALGAVAIGLLAFFLFLTSRLNREDMALLYNELDQSDSGKIISKLEALKVPFELSPDGTRIKVPSSRAARLRMEMAQEGLPSGGSIGYEIFDKSSALGTTSFAQRINQLRALEGELARSIRTLAPVQAARVHLVLPRREAFSREVEEPSASIILNMRGSNQLSRGQVQAIQQLVAAAVPKLTPGRISVIDDKGNLLARGSSDQEGNTFSAQNADEIRSAQERRLTRTIEELLERSVGLGKVRAEVAVDMDFDRVTTSSESYDPDKQVVRSTQTVNENNESRDGDKSVTVANNLPDRNATDGKNQRSNRSNRAEETVNYEISKTVKTHVREGGSVRRVTAAVLVDGRYVTDSAGAQTYEGRDPEELKKLETLVRTAIGFDESRGDKVEVVNLQFARAEEVAASMDTDIGPLGIAKADWFRLAETGTLGIVAIMVLLLVVRPLLARMMEAPQPVESVQQQALLPGQTLPALPGPDGSISPARTASGGEDPAESEEEAMVNIAQVAGRVKASAVKQVGQIIDKHPDEAIGLLRHWMHQEG